MKLADAAIGNLARMICGDDPFTFMPYRSSSKLTAFFEGLGLNYVHDGSTRYWWVRGVLNELNIINRDDNAMPSQEIKAVIEHLLNINSYLFEENLDREKAIESVNKVLKSYKLLVKEDIETGEASVLKNELNIEASDNFDVYSNQTANLNESANFSEERGTKNIGFKQKKLFISHSTKDVKYVEFLIEFLESMGVNENQIFCSSFEPYGIPLGDNFLERIKQELSNEVLVLFVLSKNFIESPICLCEMGATWVLANKHVPILIPPFDYSDIRGVIPLTQGFKISEPHKLNSFKDTILQYFDLGPMDFSKWERKRASFLKSIALD
ncbi:toll/interleukin-1 receptor domain-containing protein [Paenibacillus sp. LK1]|uniref:toll/interleukin-1 receptor domain-containing protein n=1 Tax=Paenibacillus sp. LK1 TaxID=2053014 RepID=UPI000C185391|nr:toll/interleukin-1 receptor domain-containing protein [Paenibacillus sp. LK1]PIH55332.1 hypothetical protein CS562_32065 [Paenibacillus sp. LK1]